MFELISLLNVFGMKSGGRECLYGEIRLKESLNKNRSLKLGHKYGKTYFIKCKLLAASLRHLDCRIGMLLGLYLTI